MSSGVHTLRRSYSVLERYLIGQTIIHGSQALEIVETKGYKRSENTLPSLRAPVLRLDPGEICFVASAEGLLPLIACLDGNKPGGCVLIRRVKLHGQVCDGPSQVAEALGVSQPGSVGRLTIEGAHLRFARRIS